MFQAQARECFGYTISIGISLPDHDVYRLKQLRKQSIGALNYHDILGDSFIMLYSDIVHDEAQTIVDLSPYYKNI